MLFIKYVKVESILLKWNQRIEVIGRITVTNCFIFGLHFKIKKSMFLHHSVHKRTQVSQWTSKCVFIKAMRRQNSFMNAHSVYLWKKITFSCVQILAIVYKDENITNIGHILLNAISSKEKINKPTSNRTHYNIRLSLTNMFQFVVMSSKLDMYNIHSTSAENVFSSSSAVHANS